MKRTTPCTLRGLGVAALSLIPLAFLSVFSVPPVAGAARVHQNGVRDVGWGGDDRGAHER